MTLQVVEGLKLQDLLLGQRKFISLFAGENVKVYGKKQTKFKQLFGLGFIIFIIKVQWV